VDRVAYYDIYPDVYVHRVRHAVPNRFAFGYAYTDGDPHSDLHFIFDLDEHFYSYQYRYSEPDGFDDAYGVSYRFAFGYAPAHCYGFIHTDAEWRLRHPDGLGRLSESGDEGRPGQSGPVHLLPEDSEDDRLHDGEPEGL